MFLYFTAGLEKLFNAICLIFRIEGRTDNPYSCSSLSVHTFHPLVRGCTLGTILIKLGILLHHNNPKTWSRKVVERNFKSRSFVKWVEITEVLNRENLFYEYAVIIKGIELKGNSSWPQKRTQIYFTNWNHYCAYRRSQYLSKSPPPNCYLKDWNF